MVIIWIDFIFTLINLTAVIRLRLYIIGKLPYESRAVIHGNGGHILIIMTVVEASTVMMVVIAVAAVRTVRTMRMVRTLRMGMTVLSPPDVPTTVGGDYYSLLRCLCYDLRCLLPLEVQFSA